MRRSKNVICRFTRRDRDMERPNFRPSGRSFLGDGATGAKLTGQRRRNAVPFLLHCLHILPPSAQPSTPPGEF